MEPLVGERRLAPEAVEVDPMALMPSGLPISDEDRALIAELVRSMQPLDPTLTSDHHDRWFIDNKMLIERLEASVRPEVGSALHAYSNYPERNHSIRKTFLQVGARVSPERPRRCSPSWPSNTVTSSRTAPRPCSSSPRWRPRPSSRARASTCASEPPDQTGPNDEFYVAGWKTAARRRALRRPHDVPGATNLAIEPYASHRSAPWRRSRTTPPGRFERPSSSHGGRLPASCRPRPSSRGSPRRPPASSARWPRARATSTSRASSTT